MKCPNCGNELEEGKLLCENCGYEVKIVPDFDIELEDRLKESISSMMEDRSGLTARLTRGVIVDLRRISRSRSAIISPKNRSGCPK